MHNSIRNVVSLLAISLSLSSAEAKSAADVAAQTQAAIDRGNAPSWWQAKLPEDIQRDVDRKGNQLADRLELGDETKTNETAALVSQHFARVWAWHQGGDKQLDEAWAEWEEERGSSGGGKDELRALTIMTEQIDPIYAEFTPQIQGFLSTLRDQIGEEKTIRLLDIITRSPGAERTFNAYVGMVPEMTDEEKEILCNRMAQAREDSLAAWSDGRIIKIFKKYKIRNEFSIDDFGYDYRKRYTEWAKGQR